MTFPDTNLDVTPGEIAAFRENGWLRLENIAPLAEVELLREIFDRLFARRAGWKEGKAFDLAGRDEPGEEPVLPQILNPVEFAPELKHTQFRANALAIAKSLLGADAEPWFEHAICKPARIGVATPWHQDEAHRYDPGVDYEQISIWMPLQPATVENGCMRYISGTHRGPVLDHRPLDGDARKSALECVGVFNPEAAVICPLPAGGAAIHHCRTLHSASPNVTAVPRRAYVLGFRGAPRPAPHRPIFPWISGRRTPAAERAEAWENRGGPVGRASRKLGRKVGNFAHRVKRRLLGN